MTARLAGVRRHFESAPAAVRAWVAQTLGSRVVEIRPRMGGMSPAVAASVRSADGQTAFVKAIGAEIHPETPDHFRHEAAILRRLPPAPYRAELYGTYDDGAWVAILMEDIPGGHPDWSDHADRDRVRVAVEQQAAELTPIPERLPAASNRERLVKYLAQIESAGESELAALPSWARRELPRLTDLVRHAIDRHRDETYNHWDIRHDNIVLRPADRQPVFVDWGMARRGTRRGDLTVFGLEWVHEDYFDDLLTDAGLTADAQRQETGFVAGLGLSCLIRSTQPAHPHLPNLPAFHRDLGLRCLEGARRRT